MEDWWKDSEREKSEIIEEKPVPVSLCLPEIPHKKVGYYEMEPSFKHQPLYPKRIGHRHTFGTGVCGSQIQSGQCGEEGNLLPVVGMEPESSCSVATHCMYTNYVILAPTCDKYGCK